MRIFLLAKCSLNNGKVGCVFNSWRTYRSTHRLKCLCNMLEMMLVFGAMFLSQRAAQLILRRACSGGPPKKGGWENFYPKNKNSKGGGERGSKRSSKAEGDFPCECCVCNTTYLCAVYKGKCTKCLPIQGMPVVSGYCLAFRCVRLVHN